MDKISLIVQLNIKSSNSPDSVFTSITFYIQIFTEMIVPAKKGRELSFMI